MNGATFAVQFDKNYPPPYERQADLPLVNLQPNNDESRYAMIARATLGLRARLKLEQKCHRPVDVDEVYDKESGALLFRLCICFAYS